jgi:K+-sensing histidine kinase KdpD
MSNPSHDDEVRVDDSADERAEPQPRSEVRGGYLGFVAHEMRNPLSTALWSAELLTRLSPEERGGARGEKLAGMCLRTLSRLRHLVEDHFLAERLAIRGLPLRLEAVVVREALATALGRVPQARFELECEGAPAVAVDKAMFERALEGLVAVCARDNALVRIQVSPKGSDVEIGFVGAPPPPNAFSMPDRSTPSDPSGRALGLLMALAVAEAHGGMLEAGERGFLLRLPDGTRAG